MKHYITVERENTEDKGKVTFLTFQIEGSLKDAKKYMSNLIEQQDSKYKMITISHNYKNKNYVYQTAENENLSA